MRWYGFLAAQAILACFSEGGRGHLATIDVGAGKLNRMLLPYTEFSGVAVENRRAILRAGRPDGPAAVILLDPASGSVTELCTAGDLPVDPTYLAVPKSIRYPSESGAVAHAFYYPPTNPDFRAPPDELPPLIVKSHGGPTGSTSSELRLSTQFWTSRGFAVCDVNYGGSTGYGRAYRERLNGRWGEIDALDCIAAARFLWAEGRADERRLAITGGSAGGYTTLCALTFHDVFRAGASHYGVSDLEALAKDTHKFESRYLDRLVGPWPEAAAVYRARSPIHHVERLSCPIIFFQGLEDAVVPPNQAELMVEALRRKGLPVAYLTFEGEQHGFRKAETIQTVLRAELAFYGRIFGFKPADGLTDLVMNPPAGGEAKFPRYERSDLLPQPSVLTPGGHVNGTIREVVTSRASGCIGLRRTFCSNSWITEGTISKAVEHSCSQESPIGRQRCSPPGSRQPTGSSATSRIRRETVSGTVICINT
jgi:dipeptidyl aminopeptidase/acylaminoacyl peptidase